MKIVQDEGIMVNAGTESERAADRIDADDNESHERQHWQESKKMMAEHAERGEEMIAENATSRKRTQCPESQHRLGIPKYAKR